MQYPFLNLNVETAKSNIRRIAAKASRLNLEFRPHFKTHQSHEIGKWFKDAGVSGITVSSLAMAEFFADADWDDITVAFPVNILDIHRINNLASRINLKMLVYDVSVIGFLSNNLYSSMSVYIEIDPKYGRSGIKLSDFDSIKETLYQIKKSKKLHFEGFYAHAGHSYKCTGEEDIKVLTIPILSELSELKNTFGGKVCWGDTPSCSVLNNFQNVDQLSPGNLVFYDWMQTRIGSCSAEDIAVKMKCPVIAKFNDRKELLIHGGAVHFSKDTILNSDGNQIFGQVINPMDLSDFSNYLKSISQEHGIISCSDDFFDSIKIGDIVEIYPIHSCLTANLMQAFITDSGDIIHQFASGAPFKG